MCHSLSISYLMRMSFNLWQQTAFAQQWFFSSSDACNLCILVLGVHTCFTGSCATVGLWFNMVSAAFRRKGEHELEGYLRLICFWEIRSVSVRSDCSSYSAMLLLQCVESSPPIFMHEFSHAEAASERKTDQLTMKTMQRDGFCLSRCIKWRWGEHQIEKYLNKRNRIVQYQFVGMCF